MTSYCKASDTGYIRNVWVLLWEIMKRESLWNPEQDVLDGWETGATPIFDNSYWESSKWFHFAVRQDGSTSQGERQPNSPGSSGENEDRASGGTSQQLCAYPIRIHS